MCFSVYVYPHIPFFFLFPFLSLVEGIGGLQNKYYYGIQKCRISYSSLGVFGLSLSVELAGYTCGITKVNSRAKRTFLRICLRRLQLLCKWRNRSTSIDGCSTAEGLRLPHGWLFRANSFSSKQGNTRDSACLLWSCGFTARRASEVNTNYMSFTPRGLTCLGLPFWHIGFREHPALQCILSVQCPALQYILLRGVFFLRKDLAFGTLEK